MAKSFITVALAATSMAAASGASVSAQAAPAGLDTSLASSGEVQLIQAATPRCYRGERAADCRTRLQVERRSHRHYVYRNGRYEDNSGAAIVGTIFGFVLGAAIAGSQDDRDYYNDHRHDRTWQNQCRTTYRGFDARSGTYAGDDGYRHYCRPADAPPPRSDLSPPQGDRHATFDANGNQHTVVSSPPVPDTPDNRARYGHPESDAGRRTHPAGD